MQTIANLGDWIRAYITQFMMKMKCIKFLKLDYPSSNQRTMKKRKMVVDAGHEFWIANNSFQAKTSTTNAQAHVNSEVDRHSLRD